MAIYLNKIILFIILLGGVVQDIPFDLNRPITCQQVENSKKSNERNQESELINYENVVIRKSVSSYFSVQAMDVNLPRPNVDVSSNKLFNLEYLTSVAKQAPCFGQLFLQKLF